MLSISSEDSSQLLNALGKGEIVLVLGAGASATSLNARGERIKQGSALAKDLAETGGIEFNGEDLPDVIGAVLGKKISKTHFHRILATNTREQGLLTNLGRCLIIRGADFIPGMLMMLSKA